MKKFAIILAGVLLTGTISGCTTSDTSSTSTETSTTTLENNYSLQTQTSCITPSSKRLVKLDLQKDTDGASNYSTWI